MALNARLARLSRERQALVRLCQSINHGHINDLIVCDHEPVLASPELGVIVDVRLDIEDCLREELGAADFVLCTELTRLMSVLDKMKNGKILKVEVRAGIPRRITCESRFLESAKLET